MIHGLVERNDLWLPEPIIEGLKFIQYAIKHNLKEDKYTIDNDDVFAMVQRYNTEDLNYTKAEVHGKYIDIQSTINGCEGFGVAQSANRHEDDQLNLEKDVLKLNMVNNEIFYNITPEQYLIFTPGEIHRPKVHLSGPHQVKKIVVKINSDIIPGMTNFNMEDVYLE